MRPVVESNSQGFGLALEDLRAPVVTLEMAGL